MNRVILSAATLLVFGLSAQNASALSVPYFDNFNSITSDALNTAPTGWNSIDGSVDSINESNPYGIHCLGHTGGCVDLDGTTSQSGYLLTSSTFNLIAGQTYVLSAQVSGNQRGAIPNNLIFGFLNTSDLVLKSKTISGIVSTSPFTLYTVIFKPTANVAAEIFFNDVLGTNDQGPILDNVRVTDLTKVPLPAAAWLMLSGLAALGAFARRRISPVGGGATA